MTESMFLDKEICFLALKRMVVFICGILVKGEGQIYYQAVPSGEHQMILSELLQDIGKYIRDNGGKCKVIPAPFAVYLNGDESEYFEPDITVVCDLNKLGKKKGCVGAPDWIVE